MRTHRRRTLALFAAAGAMLAAAPAVAHHSYAMFDKTQTRVLKGKVKDYARVNPHGYLDIEVTGASGRVQVWSVELQSTLAMEARKVGPEAFRPGDAVTVTINPLRNGTTGGAFVSAVLADGRVVGALPEVYLGDKPVAPASGAPARAAHPSS